MPPAITVPIKPIRSSANMHFSIMLLLPSVASKNWVGHQTWLRQPAPDRRISSSYSTPSHLALKATSLFRGDHDQLIDPVLTFGKDMRALNRHDQRHRQLDLLDRIVDRLTYLLDRLALDRKEAPFSIASTSDRSGVMPQ